MPCKTGQSRRYAARGGISLERHARVHRSAYKDAPNATVRDRRAQTQTQLRKNGFPRTRIYAARNTFLRIDRPQARIGIMSKDIAGAQARNGVEG